MFAEEEDTSDYKSFYRGNTKLVKVAPARIKSKFMS